MLRLIIRAVRSQKKNTYRDSSTHFGALQILLARFPCQSNETLQHTSASQPRHLCVAHSVSTAEVVWVGIATRCGLYGPEIECRSQWSSGLRRGSAADRSLGLRV